MSSDPAAVSSFDVQAGLPRPATSAVSWGAIFAGGVAAASLSLILLAFGAGVGFSSISPWSTTSASTTFHIATGLYFIVMAMLASSVGGYITGRLRTPWPGTHAREIFFRDTAHGFIAWGLATLVSAVLLSSAAGALVGGAAAGISHVAGQSPGLLDGYVDSLTRAQPDVNAGGNTNAADTNAANNTNAGGTANAGGNGATRAEIGRIFAASFQNGGTFQDADRAYLAQLVAARTGMTPAQAQDRVTATIQQAKTAVDKARKAAAQLALWLTASLLIGAFSSSLAAIEGGALREGTWRYKV